MFSPKNVSIYEKLYSWLISFYPKSFYDRFEFEMKEDFKYLLAEKHTFLNVFVFVITIYFETVYQIIKLNFKNYFMYPKTIIRSGLITVAILCVPLIAMQFLEEVNWTFLDFVLAGCLLFLSGLILEYFMKKTYNFKYKLAWFLTIFSSVLIVWTNRAVGIIGGENNNINMFYFGLPLIIAVGSAVFGLKPINMTFTLFSTAFVQTLITSIILILGLYKETNSSFIEIVSINTFFVLLFSVSGFMFYISGKNSSLNQNQKLA